MNRRRIIIFFSLVVIIIASLVYVLKIANHYPEKADLVADSNYYGVTFSTKYVDYLGLDYKDLYKEILDDLKVKKIRIPIYWDDVEDVKGEYDFDKYDYLFDEGEKRGVDFIVVVGRRVPRWPECHTPSWIDDYDEEAVILATLNMTERVINHFKHRSSVEYWQIENEAFLGSFGNCPPFNEELLREQFRLARNIDNRELLITFSGELRSWNKEAELGDLYGTTLYRVVHNKLLGFIRYPFSENFYTRKAKRANMSLDKIMVMELQAEPWAPKGDVTKLSKKEIDRSMSFEQFVANFQYANKLNFSRVYAWGVEWWYYQKINGDDSYWQFAGTLFEK